MTTNILCGALDETKAGEIVLRGVIAPTSLDGLLIPGYQREELRDATIEDLMSALRSGERFPDVCLAVRGDHYGCTDDTKGTYVITGNIYVVDGRQRITAARRLLQDGGSPLIGAMVHFATTEEWERKRFDALNLKQTRLSSNVILRNRAPDYPGLHRLYRLCSDESFVLCQRVSWLQYMRREDLLTGLALVKISMRLHNRFGAGRNTTINGLCDALAPMVSAVGAATLVENVKAFFQILEDTWGVRGVCHKERATHLRFGFLAALADVISGYELFWNGKTLRIDRDLQKKIGQFRLKEPNIDAMARSGSSATVSVLARLIVDHINSGKRTRRLVKPDLFRGGTRVAL